MAPAYEKAVAVAVMPFNVSGLIGVSLLGSAVFGTVPDVGAWIGGAAIFAAAT